jgi:hypothetical protein
VKIIKSELLLSVSVDRDLGIILNEVLSFLLKFYDELQYESFKVKYEKPFSAAWLLCKYSTNRIMILLIHNCDL